MDVQEEGSEKGVQDRWLRSCNVRLDDGIKVDNFGELLPSFPGEFVLGERTLRRCTALVVCEGAAETGECVHVDARSDR
eukprot:965989-Pleurochrysis_carterae.AAC.1